MKLRQLGGGDVAERTISHKRKLLKSASSTPLVETSETSEPAPYLTTNEKFVKNISLSSDKMRSLPVISVSQLATERQFTGRLGTFCVVKTNHPEP